VLGSVAIALAGLALLSGCGGAGDSNDQAARAAPPKLAVTAGLPRPANRSLRVLLRNLRQGPELAQSVSLLEPGKDRFGFALFDRGNRQIADLSVGLYVSRGLDETAHGPYPTRFERLEVEPRYRSKQSVTDPDAARSVYVSEIPLRSAGSYVVSAIAKLGDKLVATSPVQFMVSDQSKVPGVGDRAIRVHTPTKASVGGDVEKIDTRIPPDTMHNVDLADALDHHHPVLLLFSTPALCQSRVCGPVTDVAEEVKAEYGDRVDFIHMEIYNDNDLQKGLRPQVRAWHLRTEPFAFAINSHGIVVARLEGAFSAQELRAAVRKALRRAR
jgi:hypothetical protein